MNGTVGAGKSTLADALSAAERSLHAVIDLDQIRRLHPATRSDPFSHELELQNLRSLVGNFRRAGARRIVLAGVIENPAEVARYTAALETTGMFICRLVAPSAVLASRLRHRHRDDPDGLQWHLARAGQLAQILEAASLDDLVLDSSRLSVIELARVVRLAAGWASQTEMAAGPPPCLSIPHRTSGGRSDRPGL
ncbi:AAA family ATPase [Saxibacter everestensis]|uniref:AAA family ATPase n=1 Tax=Saxibacter everestensis TaxID=2909229 RepID=A0ABY8R0W3_9MICO|nr:AAA family ATPase [Brevibacteriaceae bacterium ZFBP1038]